MPFELAIQKGSPNGIQGQTTVQVACLLPSVYVDCLQSSSPPVSGFLFKDFGTLPVHSVVVIIRMYCNPILIVLSLYCILMFHNSLLQISPCLANVAFVTIHAWNLIHNTSFFSRYSLGVFIFTRAEGSKQATWTVVWPWMPFGLPFWIANSNSTA